jgi:hypothetical protein
MKVYTVGFHKFRTTTNVQNYLTSHDLNDTVD